MGTPARSRTVTSADTGPDLRRRWTPEVTQVTGRFVDASNATLLGETADGTRVIYKPVAGERPLWDFSVGTLAAREVLTYEVAMAMGLDIVPETVWGDGLYGPGAIQRFVEVDREHDPLPAARVADPALWPVAVLDLVCNNADRKLGHILAMASTRRIVAIDHGLTFHPEDKLRTVLWAFAGEPLPLEMRNSVTALEAELQAGLAARIAEALGAEESEALMVRVAAIRADPHHPEPPDDRPPMPWPIY